MDDYEICTDNITRMASTVEKISIKKWPQTLVQGSFGQLVSWIEQLGTQVVLCSNFGESGGTYLHFLTVFEKKSNNRFLKPLLEPIEGEHYMALKKPDRARYEPVSLTEYLETALEDALEKSSRKAKVNQTQRAQALAEVYATAVVNGDDLDWPTSIQFMTPTKPIKQEDEGGGAVDPFADLMPGRKEDSDSKDEHAGKETDMKSLMLDKSLAFVQS